LPGFTLLLHRTQQQCARFINAALMQKAGNN